MLEVAGATEAAGIEQLWLWKTASSSPASPAAAAILSHTSTLRVGIGLLPVPLRNVALTAMELATIARMLRVDCCRESGTASTTGWSRSTRVSARR